MVWIVKDACGIACAILAWLILAFSQYAILTIILLPQPDTVRKYVHIIVLELLSTCTLVAHLRTIFTDPGSVPQKTEQTPKIFQGVSDENLGNYVGYRCSECCSVKPDRAHHCSVCKRCIRKMDHHCPWVNNCIGERNQKYFALFTFYVALLSSHALYLTIGHFIACLDNNWASTPNVCPLVTRGQPAPGKFIMLVLLVFIALLFSLFSFIMFYMQMRAIWTDWNGIEKLKKENRPRVTGCKNFKAVCGEHFLLWLLPCSGSLPAQELPHSYLDQTNHDSPV